MSSHREDVSKEFGERGEDKKPDSDGDEDPAAPCLHPWCLSLDARDRLLLPACDREGGGKHHADENDGSDHEGEKSSLETAHGERVAGQTGQDRPCSAESGEHIAETEHREPCDRSLPS